MLTSIRKTSSSLFVKLLFVLLIASFAVWGIGDVLQTTQGEGPIEVGDRKISIATVDREFRGLLEQQSQAMGLQLSPVQGIQFGLLDQAVSNLIGRALIDELAANAGLRVDDDTIRLFIRDEMGFRTAAGAFDRAAFEQDMRRRNMTEQVFVDQLRRDIAREDLLQAVIGGVRVPEIEAETLRAYREEVRVADFVRIDAEAMDAPSSPSDTTLQSFYAENGDAYMAPEYRAASVVILDPDEIAAGIDVGEEQLNEEFLYRRDSLFVPEEREIEQMILADADQAEAAQAALQEGRDFASVAAEIAGQDEAGIGMGAFSESDWFLPEVADTLFDGAVGTVSEPVETALGWRIYRVAGIEPAHEPNLDEVRDDLTQEVAGRIADDMVFDLSTQFQDEIAGGQSLAQAAVALGLEIENIPPVSADGLGRDGSPVAVPGGDAVLNAMFQEEVGIVSNQYDLPNGGVFFVEVEAVTEPAPRPFTEVRDQVSAAWTEEQRLEAARVLAQSIEDSVATGTDLAALARERGLEVQTADGIRRDGQSTGGLPRGLAADLFALERGEAAMSQATDSNAFFVAQLREVVPAPADPEAVRELWLQLSAESTNDALQALGNALQGRVQPTVQNELIRQTFMQSYGS